MQRLYLKVAAAALALMASGCASISKDECRAGDWAAIGQRDGAEGYPPSRLESHAKVCANFNITPDPVAYQGGWDQGILVYCTPLNGFTQGRAGNAYHGLCPASVAGGFLEGRQVGQALGDVERRVSAAENIISSAMYERDRIEAEIDRVLGEDGLSREERRETLRRLREDLRYNRQREEDARWELRAAQRELIDMQHLASDFLARNGGAF